jgi:PAS domain S-box-containing protein
MTTNDRGHQERLHAALDAAGVGVWDFYPQTGVLVWSDRCKQLFGLALDAAVDYGVFLGGLHPDDRGRADQAVQRALRPEVDERFDIEFRALAPDGSLRWLRSTGKARFEAGAPVRFVGTIIEITERKQRELKELRLGQIAECSADFIAYASPEGKALYLNPAGLALVGLADLEEVQRHSIDDFFAPEDQYVLRTQILPAVEQRGRWVGELRLRHFRSGRAIPSQYELFRVDDPATGALAGYASVAVDLTRRKRAEDDYHFLADSVPQLLSTLNPRGDITYVNRGVREFTGRTHEELALHWFELVHPEDGPRVRAAWADARAGSRGYKLEYRLRRRDGVYRWLRLECSPQLDGEGRVLQWVRSSTDIHDLKTALEVAERRLAALAAELAAGG